MEISTLLSFAKLAEIPIVLLLVIWVLYRELTRGNAINNLAQSVKGLTSQLEGYKNEIDTRVNNEIKAIKNKVENDISSMKESIQKDLSNFQQLVEKDISELDVKLTKATEQFPDKFSVEVLLNTLRENHDKMEEIDKRTQRIDKDLRYLVGVHNGIHAQNQHVFGKFDD